MAKIAILLATYNGEKYIKEQLDSLKRQTCQDFVCYLQDDGSTDKTVEAIHQWMDANVEGMQYQLLDGPSCGGAKENFLWMLTQVDAEYYMFCDQDDVWLPNKIEKSLAALTQGDRLCVFTDMCVVDENLKVTDTSFIRHIGRSPQRIGYAQIIMDNPAAGCTMMFTRQLRNLAMQLPDSKQIQMHDVWVLSLAAAMGEDRVAAIDEPLVCYRQHGNNEMGAQTESRMEKLGRNIRDFCNGTIAQEKKQFLQISRDLAGQLAMIEEIPKETREILQKFSRIGTKNKLQRILFYRAYDFTRLSGNAWMLLWV